MIIIINTQSSIQTLRVNSWRGDEVGSKMG